MPDTAFGPELLELPDPSSGECVLLAARRIWASCDAQNVRSIRVLERCSFAREGTLKNERRNPQGGLCDTLLCALTPPP